MVVSAEGREVGRRHSGVLHHLLVVQGLPEPMLRRLTHHLLPHSASRACPWRFLIISGNSTNWGKATPEATTGWRSLGFPLFRGHHGVEDKASSLSSGRAPDFLRGGAAGLARRGALGRAGRKEPPPRWLCPCRLPHHQLLMGKAPKSNSAPCGNDALGPRAVPHLNFRFRSACVRVRSCS